MHSTTVASDDTFHIILNNVPKAFIGAQIVIQGVTPAGTLTTQLVAWTVTEDQVGKSPYQVQLASGNAAWIGLNAATISSIRVTGVSSDYGYLSYSGKDISWSFANAPSS